MRLVCISDTHGYHHDMPALPEGDVLICAGDCTKGSVSTTEEWLQWFSTRKFPHKIFIAGNHDWVFERWHPDKIASIIPEGVTYLNDSGCTIDGVKFWGSPVQPWFLDWAFNRTRGPAIRRHWDLIPTDTDVLITHGPPADILDIAFDGAKVGCIDLLERIQVVKPKVHIFGHIHFSYGATTKDGTQFINCSICGEDYKPTRHAFIYDLKT